MKFAGVYRPDKSYEAGDAAIHHSALWVCKATTTGEPGKDFVGWQLALKSGSVR